MRRVSYQKEGEINETTVVFQNNCQVGKSEETTLFAAGIYIYIYIYIYEYICVCKVGTTIQKARKRKEDGKTKRAKKFFHSHMNRRNASYVQGAKC